MPIPREPREPAELPPVGIYEPRRGERERRFMELHGRSEGTTRTEHEMLSRENRRKWFWGGIIGGPAALVLAISILYSGRPVPLDVGDYVVEPTVGRWWKTSKGTGEKIGGQLKEQQIRRSGTEAEKEALEAPKGTGGRYKDWVRGRVRFHLTESGDEGYLRGVGAVIQAFVEDEEGVDNLPKDLNMVLDPKKANKGSKVRVFTVDELRKDVGIEPDDLAEWLIKQGHTDREGVELMEIILRAYIEGKPMEDIEPGSSQRLINYYEKIRGPWPH